MNRNPLSKFFFFWVIFVFSLYNKSYLFCQFIKKMLMKQWLLQWWWLIIFDPIIGKKPNYNDVVAFQSYRWHWFHVFSIVWLKNSIDQFVVYRFLSWIVSIFPIQLFPFSNAIFDHLNQFDFGYFYYFQIFQSIFLLFHQFFQPHQDIVVLFYLLRLLWWLLLLVVLCFVNEMKFFFFNNF